MATHEQASKGGSDLPAAGEATTDAPVKGKRTKTPLRRPRGKRGGVKHKGKAAAVQAKQDRPVKAKAAAAATTDKGGESDHAQRIAEFHTLQKRIAQAQSEAERIALQAQIDASGGLQAYQDASLFGGDKQRGGETGKWCAQALAEARGTGDDAEQDKVRLLDVGSLSGTAYERFSQWIEATSIDINPRSERVLKYDFFDYPVPAHAGRKFDVVCLSLVVNFIGDLAQRGQMLLRAHHFVRADARGRAGQLFLVLPLACVQNSRYLTHAHLRDILRAAGWGDVVRQDDSARLTRWLVRETSKTWSGQTFAKRELRKGAALNNFCIVLR